MAKNTNPPKADDQGGLPLPEDIVNPANLNEILPPTDAEILARMGSGETLDGGKALAPALIPSGTTTGDGKPTGMTVGSTYKIPNIPLNLTGRPEMDQFSPGTYIGLASPDYIVRADAEAMLSALESKLISEIARLNDQLSSTRISSEGLLADMVGGIFNCPKCGLRLNSPSLTGIKGGLYEHPFQESPKLSGVQCELKGLKFNAPIVFLQFADPKLQPRELPSPLTSVTK